MPRLKHVEGAFDVPRLLVVLSPAEVFHRLAGSMSTQHGTSFTQEEGDWFRTQHTQVLPGGAPTRSQVRRWPS